MYSWKIEIKHPKSNTVTTVYLTADSSYLAEKAAKERYPGYKVVSMRLNE